MKDPNNDSRRDDQSSPAEKAIVSILSRIGWMDSQERTHKAVRQLRKTSSLEFFEHWLTKISMLDCTVDDAPLLDQLVQHVDPNASLAIKELAELIARPTVIHFFRESLSSSYTPSPSIPETDRVDLELTPLASEILGRLDMERSGSFTAELLEAVRTRMSPAAFEQLAVGLERIGAYYALLKPVYCDTPLAEIVRETRRILKHRWHTDMLTPDDVAVFFDKSMLNEVELSLLQRVR